MITDAKIAKFLSDSKTGKPNADGEKVDLEYVEFKGSS